MAKPFRNDGKPRINDGLKVLLDNLDKIKELASLNLSINKICSCLGLSVRAYYYHLDEHPEIQQAVEDGRALGVKKVAESLIKTAQRGNVTAQIFFLKNADPENWNKESTTVNTNVNIQSVEDLSDSDLDKAIKALEKKENKASEEK